MTFLFTFSTLIFYFPLQSLPPRPQSRIPACIRQGARYLCAYKAPFCAFLWLKNNSMISASKNLCNLLLKICAICGKNQRNPRLIKDLRLFNALYNCREISTSVESSLQINLFMQNKANFQKVKFDVTKVLTKDYDRMDTWSIRKTKPIQSQLKPIKANSKPIKANSKTIKANIMPKQSQFKPKQTHCLPAVPFGGLARHQCGGSEKKTQAKR